MYAVCDKSKYPDRGYSGCSQAEYSSMLTSIQLQLGASVWVSSLYGAVHKFAAEHGLSE